MFEPVPNPPADTPARSIAWLGIPTSDPATTVRFFTQHLGLVVEVQEPDFVILRLPSGQAVELFGGDLQTLPQFARGPVVGFEVDDVRAHRGHMESAGVQFVGPVHDGDAGAAWTHFTGPGGVVFELTQLPAAERTSS